MGALPAGAAPVRADGHEVPEPHRAAARGGIGVRVTVGQAVVRSGIVPGVQRVPQLVRPHPQGVLLGEEEHIGHVDAHRLPAVLYVDRVSTPQRAHARGKGTLSPGLPCGIDDDGALQVDRGRQACRGLRRLRERRAQRIPGQVTASLGVGSERGAHRVPVIAPSPAIGIQPREGESRPGRSY